MGVADPAKSRHGRPGQSADRLVAILDNDLDLDLVLAMTDRLVSGPAVARQVFGSALSRTGEEVKQVQAGQTSGDNSAVAKPGASVDRLLHAHQRSGLAGDRVPDPQGAVVPTRGQPAAICSNRHR